EGRKAASVLPGVLKQVGNGQIVWQVGGEHGGSYATESQLERLLVAHRDALTAAFQSFAARAAAIGTNAGWLLLIPILAIFFLKDKRALGEGGLDLIEENERRTFARRVLGDLD